MKEYLGIDIGGTNVKMGVVDESGHIHDFHSYPTAEWRKGNKFIEKLGEAIQVRLTIHKNVTKVGIGIPGTVSKDRRTVLEVTAIPELNGINLADELQTGLPGISILLENDASAAGLGELYFSKEPIEDDFAFVTLGTGVGGVAIIDRKIFLGADGNSMELGHMVSRYGKRLEQNIGKQGMLNLAAMHIQNYQGATMLKASDISTTKLILAAEQKDELAMQVFNEIGEILGEGLVAIVRILDIKTIIIGGGLSATFEYIKGGMDHILNKYLTPYYLESLSVRKATLGNDAGILGAASLCFSDEVKS